MSRSSPHPPLVPIVAAGCVISLLTFGIRSSFGLFTGPLTAARGWDREVFGLALAVQNLLWGLGQPLAGILVDRHGAARVLAAGGLLYALGVGLTAAGSTPLALHATAGALVGFGMSGASTMTVIGALGRLVPEARRSWALGMVTAAGSLGQFLIVPLGQAVISTHGWAVALVVLAGLAAAVPAAAAAFRGASAAPTAGPEPEIPVRVALRAAFTHPSYLLLLAGFFVCGFQLAFVTIHLPAHLTDAGAGPALAAWALGLVGLFNVAGAYLAGLLGARASKKNLLSGIYLGRAVATALFVALPVSPATILPYGAVMGLLWLSTVPLTSGLVAVMFGTRHLASLFGWVFLGHQLGSFLGAWLGGAVVARTGSYGPVWWLTVLLALAAALVHWPIAERRAAGAGATGGP